MQAAELNLTREQVQKLLHAADCHAAMLYLYLQSGNPMQDARTDLNMSELQFQCASATLRQLGLWAEKKAPMAPVGERPNYSETDVITATGTDDDFAGLCEEMRHLMGKPLNNEELKIVLGFVRYLGMSGEVIVLLVNHCIARAERRNKRRPSLRTIEKEAYAWAERGIETIEEASAYVRAQAMRDSRLGRLISILQINGRNLTPGEEKYAQQWLDWGFDEEAISMAYERTCINTGGLSWAYMNKILTRWQQAGLLTGQQVCNGDKKPVPKGASGRLGDAELEAIRKLMQEV